MTTIERLDDRERTERFAWQRDEAPGREGFWKQVQDFLLSLPLAPVGRIGF